MKLALSLPHGDDAFSRFVLFSFGAHILVFTIFFVRAALIPSEPLEIRNAIRVDVVDLPDKIVENATTAPKPVPQVEVKKPDPVVKPVPEKKPEVVKENAKDLQKKALEKLKALDAIDKFKKETAEQEKPKAKPTTFKGNAINTGDSLTGLEKVQFDSYFGALRTHLNQHWSIPQWLERADLRAQALVVLDESGLVTKREILKTSGNDIFDGHVLDAIDKSSPFPVPPERLKGIMSMRGIVLNFPD